MKRRSSNHAGAILEAVLLAAVIGLLLWAFMAMASAGEREEVAAIAARYGLQDEVVLADTTRVDLLSGEYAIEVDFSDKWAEAIGQSAYYAIQTKREPGILLIKRNATSADLHRKYIARCAAVCRKYEMKLWTAKEGNPAVWNVELLGDPFARDSFE